MSKTPKLRDHRLQIMEGVLDWEGEIGNARVRKLFDLQPVQASRLLAEFRTRLEGRIIEDSRAKVLRLINPEIRQSSMPLDEYVRLTHTQEDFDSCVIDARIDLTDARPTIFAILRKAAMTKTGVEIGYASMSNPIFTERTIFPHSIVHIGRRWHVRAWCSRREGFRDFTLGRIKSAMPIRDAAPHAVSEDNDWNHTIQIRLAAHHKLSVEQQQVVRNEYFKGTMARRLTIRACLAQYAIQDIRAAIDPERDIPPEYQIEVTNVKEVAPYLFGGI